MANRETTTVMSDLNPAAAMSMVRAARGFSCLFWGIPLGLLLFSSRTVGFGGAVTIGLLRHFRLPTYAVAVLLMILGAAHLYRAGLTTRSWSRYVRFLIMSLFLQLYLSPFYHWWDIRPYENLFMLNVLGLLLATTCSLYLINQVSALAGLVGGEDTFYIEAKLCAWSVVLLMALPIGGCALYATIVSLRFDTSIYSELMQLCRGLNSWVYALFLLPFTLTMASTWKAKETCLLRLRTLTGEMASPEPEALASEAVEYPVGPTAD